MIWTWDLWGKSTQKSNEMSLLYDPRTWGPINSFLCGGDGVDSCHQSLFDAKWVVDNLEHKQIEISYVAESKIESNLNWQSEKQTVVVG